MNTISVTKILFLAANPKNTTPLRLDEELREIDEGLRRATHRDQFELAQKWAVRPGDMQRAISDLSPQIVHFSGHGLGTEGGEPSAQGMRNIGVSPETALEPEGLVLEDETGQIKLVDTEAIAGLFELFADRIECVVLNACYSVNQAEAIAQHIPYVIGMSRAVGDTAARVFAVGFYDALGAGRDLEFAYRSGCVAIKMAGIPEDLTPVLKRQLDLLKPSPSEDDICIDKSNGNFYIVSSRLEQRCYEELVKPGTLIRIKSPAQMGKTKMMSRVLDYFAQKGYRITIIDLRAANQQFLSDINLFLQWFSANVSDQLNIDQGPEENWKTFLGPNTNCTKYFAKYLLSSEEQPLIIALDNFDCIFEHPEIETDFCGLLRGWFEKANTSKVWGELRQIIVYSQEPYAKLNIDQSPFNVGLPIELGELDPLQVLALANAYGLSWTTVETEKLMNMIGGHPDLIQKALDKITHQNISLDELLRTAPTEEGIYGDYLNERLQNLEKNPPLVEAMKQVVNSDIPVLLRSKEAFQLDSMGLIKSQGNCKVSRCNLYRYYFRDRLR